MADQASDFMRDYQALAQQSWEAWTRQLQQLQPASPAPANPFFKPPPAAGSEALERTLAGLKGYFDWMQGAAAAGGAGNGTDWNQQLQQWLGGASQPFAQAMGGIDSAGAESFAKQWLSWLQAAGKGGFGEMPGSQGPTPSFGLNREQQMQQQATATAMFASLQAAGRYQALLQKSNAQAMEKLQDKLAAHAEPGRQIDSLKGLYDLWVDAAEEAYAEIALSDEFREIYGEMVNTQMRARQLQQQQTEQICRELGVPTRGEVTSIGKRLQELRRELRASAGGSNASLHEELRKMRRELDELKQQLAAVVGSPGKAPVAARTAKISSRPASAKKSTAAKKPARKAASTKRAASTRKAASTKKAAGSNKTASTKKAAGAKKASSASKPASRKKASGSPAKKSAARRNSRARK